MKKEKAAFISLVLRKAAFLLWAWNVPVSSLNSHISFLAGVPDRVRAPP
ncbi:MAG: hypothetical protein WCA04_07130 [Geobacteraceae bacterium]